MMPRMFQDCENFKLRHYPLPALLDRQQQVDQARALVSGYLAQGGDGALDSARAARVCDDTRLLVRTRIGSAVATAASSPLGTVL
jgi:hypothetical protein